MRKSIITHNPQDADLPPGLDWVDLETKARAEFTSEDPTHPLEAALRPGLGAGWRASESGRQTIRLVFDTPLTLRRVHLAFQEEESARTHEFLLRWSSDGGATYKDIVRQKYTFSPPDNAREIENYDVELTGVTGLEITMFPDICGGPARASIAELRLA
jgi:uncharacterized protein (DUF736 family)